MYGNEDIAPKHSWETAEIITVKREERGKGLISSGQVLLSTLWRQYVLKRVSLIQGEVLYEVVYCHTFVSVSPVRQDLVEKGKK